MKPLNFEKMKPLNILLSTMFGQVFVCGFILSDIEGGFNTKMYCLPPSNKYA
jgi:hypothetical protein